MADAMLPSIKERLWHKMRSDLEKFIPEISRNQLLMCCACGRFLPQQCFDLEHLIPQQALKADPPLVRNNPATPANVRSGNLLLCKQPLLYKNSKLYDNGCNSWKGRFYDRPISEIFSGKAMEGKGRVGNPHIIGGLVLGYLAMVAEFGFVVTLMQSGRLMREQFFLPHRFHPRLGTRHQIILAGSPFTETDEKVWQSPFSFSYQSEGCIVAARNFSIIVPVDRDPKAPFARHLKIVPSKYKFRPDFSTSFD